MESITVKGELLFELSSKQEWVNRVPQILPEKTRGGEQWVWVDKNGNVFECGLDFEIAEEWETYPCKVYRLQSVSVAPKAKLECKHSTVDRIDVFAGIGQCKDCGKGVKILNP